MAKVTYYVAIPFIRNGFDELFGLEPVECQNAAQAKSRAREMAAAEGNVGAIAFSRSGDPNLGDFEPAVELARYGETPDDLE